MGQLSENRRELQSYLESAAYHANDALRSAQYLKDCLDESVRFLSGRPKHDVQNALIDLKSALAEIQKVHSTIMEAGIASRNGK